MSDDFDYVAAKLARLERVFHPIQTLRPRLTLLSAQSRRWVHRLRRRLLVAKRAGVTTPRPRRPA